MARGRFDLRGWEYTGQEHVKISTSILGLNWNKEDDTLLEIKIIITRIANRCTSYEKSQRLNECSILLVCHRRYFETQTTVIRALVT